MQRTLELRKLHVEDRSFRGNSMDFVCNECGKAFEKPILATVLSSGRVQKYYACPRCMTRINQERNDTVDLKDDVKKPLAKFENSVDCKHFLGYLKGRQKDAPFPDECLTCDKMIECLVS